MGVPPALIAAGFLEYEREQADRRMKAGGHPPETFPEGSTGEARDKAGERMHASGRTVDDAVRVDMRYHRSRVRKATGTKKTPSYRGFSLCIPFDCGCFLLPSFGGKSGETW